MRWIDSHCHLDSLEGDPTAALAAAASAGVVAVITVGTDLASSQRAIHDAERHESVWAVVGIHPHEARHASQEALDEIEELAQHPRAVGIGEIGLDYFRDHSPRQDQLRAFRLQLRMAKKINKPVVLHLRDAFEDAFEVLESEVPPERLIFHCFSGDPTHAQRAVSIGGILSFAGNVSFKSAEPLREAARIAGLGRLLVETDSPYLAPMPHRGKSNSPSFVPLVGRAVAQALGKSSEDVATATFERAVEVFELPL